MTPPRRLRCDRPATHGRLCDACLADELADRDLDDDCDPEGPAFECAGFNDGSGFYCPLWGSEECDWECPFIIGGDCDDDYAR